MSMLPYKVMQSDGGVLKCLATFADKELAYGFYDYMVESLHEEAGTRPSLWMEEFIDDHWSVASPRDLEKERWDMVQFFDKGEIDGKLQFRRITQNEKEIIVASLMLKVQQMGRQVRGVAYDELQWVFNNTRLGQDHDTMTTEDIKRILIEPWQQIERLESLASWISRNHLVVEATIIIPDMF